QANTLLLGNGSGQLATTSAGTNGQVLALVGGIPTWQATTTLSTISGTLAQSQGGTGLTSYVSGDLIYADTNGNLTTLPHGSPGAVLKISGGLPFWGTDLTSGGGGGAGAWSTTTDSLAVYPTDTTNVILVGASATTTIGNIFEVHGSSYFSNNIAIGATTTAFAKLSIGGAAGGTSSLFAISTSTAAFATTTAFLIDKNGNVSINNGATLTLNSALNGPLQVNNGVVSATSSIGIPYGGTGTSTLPTYGKLLVGNSLGGYDYVATSSLGLITSAI